MIIVTFIYKSKFKMYLRGLLLNTEFTKKAIKDITRVLQELFQPQFWFTGTKSI